MEKIALSTPILVGGLPNINWAYGPWNSIDDAIKEFNTAFQRYDPIKNQLVVEIPVGTTIAIYSGQNSITEYWYINLLFVEKNTLSEVNSNQIYQTLYTYTTIQIESFNEYLEQLFVLTENDIQLNDVYETNGLQWYSKEQSLSEKNRYEYITKRLFVKDENSTISAKWSDPVLIKNFAVDGKDGMYKEFIYKIGNQDDVYASWEANIKNIKGNINFEDSHGWTNNPTGITKENPLEWCSTRNIEPIGNGQNNFGEFCEPFIWASFGEEGPDGPGVEYIYRLATKTETITKPNNSDEDDFVPSDLGWHDNPQQVTYDYPYLYMCSRKKQLGSWLDWSSPIIWNEFGITYKLSLSNDNCSIPCSNSDNYTIEAIKESTLSSISLKQGINDVPLEGLIFKVYHDNTELLSDLYFIDINKKTFLLTSTNLDFTNPLITIIVGKSHSNVFTEYDRCVLTVRLNKSGMSYLFNCVPNSRIWYGGDEYSVLEFQAYVYNVNSEGVRTRINDLSDYKVCYQFSDELDSTTKSLASNGRFTIDGGLSSSIYLMLKKGDSVLDTETIDVIDYSSIKGEDNQGVTFEYEEQINIYKGASLEYVKNRTKLRLTAWQGTNKIDYTVDSYSAIFTESGDIVSVIFNKNELDYCLNQQIESDVLITTIISITDENGLNLIHYIIQNVTVDSSNTSYNLNAYPNYLTFDKGGNINCEGIALSVTSSSGDVPSDYEILLRIDDDIAFSLYLTLYFDIADYGGYIGSDLDKLHYYTFILKIDGLEKDYESVVLKPDENAIPSTFHIDLSNPYIQYPLTGISDSEVRKSWTSNTFTVYDGKTQLSLKINDLQPLGKYFTANATDSIISFDNGKSYLNKDVKETCTIFYEIVIYDKGEEVYRVNKALTIQVTNYSSYQLISNPTSITADFNKNGSFTYTPKVNLLTINGISEVTDFRAAKIYYKINNSGDKYYGSTNISYNQTDTGVTISLYNESNTLLDLDRISIVRNGAPGLSAETFSVRMCGKWDPDTRYCYKSDIDQNNNYISNPTDKFIDVVWVSNGTGDLVFYQALKGNYSNQNKGKEPTANSDYWKLAPSYGVLLAEQVLITDSKNNDITGGITNNNSDYILWAGGSGSTTNDSAENASFSVTRDGILKAKKGIFEGTYAPSLNIINTFKLSEDIDFRLTVFNILTEPGDSNDPDNLFNVTPIITLPKSLDISYLSDSIYCNWESNPQVSTSTTLTIFNDVEDIIENVPILFSEKPSIALPNGCLLLRRPDSIHPDTTWKIAVKLLCSNNPETDMSTPIKNATELNKVFLSWLTNGGTGVDDDTTIAHVVNNNSDKIRGYMATQFKRALPFVGKKIVVLNSPNIYGLRTEGCTPLDYITGLYYDSVTEGEMIIIECKMDYIYNVEDIENIEDIENVEKIGYYIYWESVYKTAMDYTTLTENIDIPKLSIN